MPDFLLVRQVVPFGQTIAITANFIADSSLAQRHVGVATAVSVTNPFVVTTTQDNGNNANPILGSLRQVIESLNSASLSTSTVTFNIPTTDPGYNPATSTFTIKLPAVLPAIGVQETLDGTTESTFLGQTAFIEINGNGLAGDGLTLGTGSDGGTTVLLEIVDFAGRRDSHRVRRRLSHRQRRDRCCIQRDEL